MRPSRLRRRVLPVAILLVSSVTGSAPSQGYLGFGYIGRTGPAGTYLFRVESNRPRLKVASFETLLLEVDADRLSAREIPQTGDRLVGSGNGNVALAAFVRPGNRLEVVSRRGSGWRSEGFIKAAGPSDPFFTMDQSGTFWAVVRSSVSRRAEVFRRAGGRWRSVLQVSEIWEGDPSADPEDLHSIDWGLLRIGSASVSRWAEPPPSNEPLGFLYHRLPGGSGAAVRMDGVPEGFLLSPDDHWSALAVGPWHPFVVRANVRTR